MITKANYYEKVNEIGLKNLDSSLIEVHEVINAITKNGSDWSAYDADKEIQQLMQEQFDIVESLNKKSTKSKASDQATAKFKPGDVVLVKGYDSITNKHGKEGTVKSVFKISSGAIIPGEGVSKPQVKYSYSVEFSPDYSQSFDENELTLIPEEKRKKTVRRSTHKAKLLQKNDPREKKSTPKRIKVSKPKFEPGQILCSWDNDGTPMREKIHAVTPDSAGNNIYIVNYGGNTWKYSESEIISSIRNKTMAINVMPPKFQEVVPKEITFIRKYLRLNGNTISQTEIVKFIKSLQLSITKREIRKTSDWAGEIMQIQNNLVKAHNKMLDDKASDIRISIAPETVESLQIIANSVAIERHIVLIKRFLSWLSNTNKDKARKLLADIKKEKFGGKIAAEMAFIVSALENFLNDQPMKLSEMQLNGLCELCGISGLGFLPNVFSTATGLVIGKAIDKIISTPAKKNDVKIISSEEIQDTSFKVLPFTGKFKQLIGEPSPGFSCLMFGPPKSGKSTLAIEFAHYLAENFGSVLYVAAEEGINATLSDKIKRLDAYHERLFFAAEMPVDLTAYKFVFIDSINRARLSHEALVRLINENPRSSFIFISQVTKDGAYRGSRELEHDVDCVIEVDSSGVAKGYGRFAPRGEVVIDFG